MSRHIAISIALAAVIAGCTGGPAPAGSAPATPTSRSGASSGPVTQPPASPSASLRPRLPSFAPDEPLVLFNRLTGAGGGVFVARPDGSGIQELATDVPGVNKRADWSPDGQRVVFIGQTERMYIAHLDGSLTEAVAVCDTPGCDYPSWSPDGRKIAFSRVENGAAVGPAAVSVNVIDLDTREVTTVIKLERPRLADVPRWSPDGTQIVFGVDRMDDDANETGATIAIVPLSGGAPRYLTDFELFGYAPDWGWKTNEIAFATDIAGAQKDFDPTGVTWDLWLIHPDGTGLRKLTHAKPGEGLKSPRWTPDGTHLTAYDLMTENGILVDPKTGTFEPFATKGPYTRPLIRPLP
jgi:TolB protein